MPSHPRWNHGDILDGLDPGDRVALCLRKEPACVGGVAACFEMRGHVDVSFRYQDEELHDAGAAAFAAHALTGAAAFAAHALTGAAAFAAHALTGAAAFAAHALTGAAAFAAHALTGAAAFAAHALAGA